MARCEEFPCCGHEPGCCPDYDDEDRQMNIICVCGAKLPIEATYSICESCMNADIVALPDGLYRPRSRQEVDEDGDQWVGEYGADGNWEEDYWKKRALEAEGKLADYTDNDEPYKAPPCSCKEYAASLGETEEYDPECQYCAGTGVVKGTENLTWKDELWVNVYAVTRHYGGPEEGGWWYDQQTPVRCVPCVRWYSASIKERLEKEFKELDRGDISSVNGGVEHRVHIEQKAGESDPQETPHYE